MASWPLSGPVGSKDSSNPSNPANSSNSSTLDTVPYPQNSDYRPTSLGNNDLDRNRYTDLEHDTGMSRSNSDHSSDATLLEQTQLLLDPKPLYGFVSRDLSLETSSSLEGANSLAPVKSELIESGFDSENELLDPDLVDLPKAVRETAPLVDDPTIPVLTFRYFVLATLFIIPGAFIDTVNLFRTTSAAYSIFFVQIAAHWAGKWMATFPNRTIRFGGFSFRTNPGPWSVKETALVTITAKSGATGNLATNALALVEIYFGKTVPAWAAMAFMWAIVFVGYSYAAIAKQVVSHDPQFPWPQALMQTALLQSQGSADTRSQESESQEERENQESQGKCDGKQSSPLYSGESSSVHQSSHTSHMRVFFVCTMAMCIWQMFPEYLFPMTSSVALLCYAAPANATANFIGSGLGGMGVLNFLLDWANITSLVMLYPYWVQVIQFVGFVVGAWVLIPLAKWSSLFSFKHGIMSNRLFTENGSIYPTDALMTVDGHFNSTAYAHYGPVHLGPQRAWNMFADYAAYVSGIVWVVVFGWPRLRASFSRRGSRVFNDRLNKLHRAYREVPSYWYAVLFVVSVLMLTAVYSSGYLLMPWWAVFVALGVGSVIVTPLMWLYALSNFQLPVGTFNELLYGYLVQGIDVKHPAGASFFGCVAGNAWYRSQYHLELMKLGFYNHIPPTAVFFAQIYGELIGVPINYLSFRWVLHTKWDYLTGKKEDPLHQWTAQSVVTYHTNAIQYVVLGPSRLFENYPWLPYGFLVGLVAPLAVFYLHSKFPSSKLQFRLWNTTVFFSTLSHFYGNVSTGYMSRFIGGTVTMFYAFRYKNRIWMRYNYVVAAALDTGYNMALTAVFVLFSMGIRAPVWFGNDPRSVERCFAL